MPDLNTIRDNFTLGRGDLFFALKRADGTYEGERLIGNVPDFKVSTQSQSVKHYSSRRGMKTQDRDVPTQVDYASQFMTDDVNPKNLAALFLGTASVVAQTALAAQSETFASVEGGLTYQIGRGTAGNPAGLQQLTITSVKSGDDVTTYAEGDDYTQDGDLGRVTIVPGGAIADGSSIKVHYDRKAASQEQIVAGSKVVEGYIRFIAYNAEGADIDYYLPATKLAPNGDYGIITDQDWQKLGFNVSISSDAAGVPIYCNGRAYIPAP
jgi:hypothetical protein